MMAELHDWMPVILGPLDRATWLDEVAAVSATLLRPAGEDVLKVWPVSSPRKNGAELLEVVG